jgi:hypothetical protein
VAGCRPGRVSGFRVEHIDRGQRRGRLPLGDSTLMELTRQVAVHGQQIVDLLRRVATLENMFWATILLLVANLGTSLAMYRKTNGKMKEQRNHG